ncbi:ABC transporter substrate-binding protein [Candidatus Epulonipiscium viviparus]|uniref:ABC transporter substrate-binding protein n=1 Tax=Candidatus Epulonipiscium viviparus TaxID=420336 RepID=UPI0027381260|nr:ABC transporter substrate-binding protein [Candidatus Epulopiscium viviparus]
MKPIFKSVLFSAISIFSTATLAGCATTSPADTPTTSASGDYYPITITNYNYAGEEVSLTFNEAPNRVLAIYQGSIETMIALGLTDHVIASYGLDNAIKPEWEDDLALMKYNENMFSPDTETVLSLQPDLIFAWGSIFSDKKLKDVDFWHDRNINTYINSNTRAGGHPRTLSKEYTDILNIGKIFNANEAATALVDSMQYEIEAALDAAADMPSQTALLIEFYEGNITNYGATSLGGDMITSLGGTLLAPNHGNISKEEIVALNPDVIFLCYLPFSESDTTDVATEIVLNKLLLDPAFASLDAIKNNRIHPVMLGDMYASGPRTLDGIKIFSAGLYPKATN